MDEDLKNYLDKLDKILKRIDKDTRVIPEMYEIVRANGNNQEVLAATVFRLEDRVKVLEEKVAKAA